MANTVTPNVGLLVPAAGDRNWDGPLAYDLAVLEGLPALASLCVRQATTGTPPANVPLTVRVAPGAFFTASGVLVAYAGAATYAVPSMAVTYLWLTEAAALTTGAAWPTTSNHVRLAVVTASADITSVSDARVAGGRVVNPNAEAPPVVAPLAGTPDLASVAAKLEAVRAACAAFGLLRSS